jgi:hypothetical protein
MTLSPFIVFLIHSNLLEYKSVFDPLNHISSAFYFFCHVRKSDGLFYKDHLLGCGMISNLQLVKVQTSRP